MSDTIKLRPGLLVTIATRVDGGVEYQRVDLDHQAVDATDIARWETKRTIADKAEFDEATTVRSNARSLVASACITTPFGFQICPLDQVDLLNQRLQEAHALVNAFNARAQHSRVRIVTVRGQIATNDAEAVTAVREDLVGLLEALEAAVASANVQEIRAAANKATRVGRLLQQSSEAKTALDTAISSARAAAKTIAKRIEVTGLELDGLLSGISTAPISSARYLLDLSAESTGSETLPAPTWPVHQLALGLPADVAGDAGDAHEDPSADASHRPHYALDLQAVEPSTGVAA